MSEQLVNTQESSVDTNESTAKGDYVMSACNSTN